MLKRVLVLMHAWLVLDGDADADADADADGVPILF
jgi:hypothetical protein